MNDTAETKEQRARQEGAAVAGRKAGRRRLPRHAPGQATRTRGGRRRFSVRGLPIRRELGEPASPGEEAAFAALLDRLKLRVLGFDGNPWAQVASTTHDAVPTPPKPGCAAAHSRSRPAPVALSGGAGQGPAQPVVQEAGR